jgi:hypothetical protein
LVTAVHGDRERCLGDLAPAVGLLVLVAWRGGRQGRAGEILVDLTKADQRLDREQRNLACRDLVTQLLRQREDREMIFDALFAGAAPAASPEPLGNAANCQPTVDHRPVAASALDRVQLAAELVLDHRLRQQLKILLLARGHGEHACRDLEKARESSRTVATLPATST